MKNLMKTSLKEAYFLQGGGTLGLLVTKERELIYYVNGQSVGVAVSNIPKAVYVFVEPYLGSSTLSVKLISALQEVRRQNHNTVNITFDGFTFLNFALNSQSLSFSPYLNISVFMCIFTQ